MYVETSVVGAYFTIYIIIFLIRLEFFFYQRFNENYEYMIIVMVIYIYKIIIPYGCIPVVQDLIIIIHFVFMCNTSIYK